MRHGSLFSCMGSEMLAAYWMQWENVFWVEKDGFRRDVLRRRFPKTKGYTLIENLNGKEYEGRIDIVTGGFPCKQTSVGAAIHEKRAGLDGVDSGLWLQQIRLFEEIGSPWVTVENPSGVKKWEDQIQSALERIGYAVSRLEFTAYSFGLPHKRRRFIYVGNANGQRLESTRQTGSPTVEWISRLTHHGGNWLQSTPGDGGGIDGLSHRVDRIKALGDSNPPFIHYEAFKAIDLIRGIEL